MFREYGPDDRRDNVLDTAYVAGYQYGLTGTHPNRFGPTTFSALNGVSLDDLDPEDVERIDWHFDMGRRAGQEEYLRRGAHLNGTVRGQQYATID